MAWFSNDYDRNYRSDRYSYPNTTGRYTEGPAYRGLTNDRAPTYGATRGYGYDYDYRVAPEQSPTYGRQADEQVQRWARNHGYDEGLRISPSGGSEWHMGSERSFRAGPAINPDFNRNFDRDFDRDLSWEPQTSSGHPRAGRRDWSARRSYRW